MIINYYAENRIAELYRLLTHSDFQGNYEDDMVVTLLYVMSCIDSFNRDGKYLADKEYVVCAKQILRINETYELRQVADVSLKSWSKALLDFKAERKLTLREINKMNSDELTDMVLLYLDQYKNS